MQSIGVLTPKEIKMIVRKGGIFYQKKPEDSILSRTAPWFLSTVRILIKNSEVKNGDEWRLFVTLKSLILRALRNDSCISDGLKIRCGKNLRTDFAIYGGVGDFANFYDFYEKRFK